MARNRGGGSRLVKEWNGLNAIVLDLTADGTVLGSSLNFASAATVMRMLGEYVITPTSGGPIAADDAAVVSVGVGVVSTDAFNAGATAMPDPGSEPEFPWLYWMRHAVYMGAGTVADNAEQIGGAVRESFDVRGMRKMKPSESLALIVEYSDLQGTPALTLTFGGARVLIGD